jgi:hypothetical protein
LTLTYKLTASSPEGAGISYVVADAPAGAAVKSVVPFTVREPSEQRDRDARVIVGSGHGAELSAVLARINATYGAADYAAVGRAAQITVQYRRTELVKELLSKARH